MNVVLQGFEQVRKIHVDSEPFSVDNPLTIPTFQAHAARVLTGCREDWKDSEAK